MAELFARVSVLIGVAFALGVAVGWAFWRFQRRSVPVSEWRATQDDLAELRRRFEEAAPGAMPWPPSSAGPGSRSCGSPNW